MRKWQVTLMFVVTLVLVTCVPVMVPATGPIGPVVAPVPLEQPVPLPEVQLPVVATAQASVSAIAESPGQIVKCWPIESCTPQEIRELSCEEAALLAQKLWPPNASGFTIVTPGHLSDKTILRYIALVGSLMDCGYDVSYAGNSLVIDWNTPRQIRPKPTPTKQDCKGWFDELKELGKGEGIVVAIPIADTILLSPRVIELINLLDQHCKDFVIVTVSQLGVFVTYWGPV